MSWFLIVQVGWPLTIGCVGKKAWKTWEIRKPSKPNQSVYCHDMLHPHSPKKFLLDSSPKSWWMEGFESTYGRLAFFFFFESTQNKSSQPQKREVFVLKTNTTLSPPKKKQTSTIIYQLTAPHFFKILSSFPPNKHLCYLGLGVVGRSGDGRVASRVDAFPRSLRSSALDLSTTHTTSTI